MLAHLMKYEIDIVAIPQQVAQLGSLVTPLSVAVLVIAIASGLDYVVTWSRKAAQQRDGEH